MIFTVPRNCRPLRASAVRSTVGLVRQNSLPSPRVFIWRKKICIETSLSGEITKRCQTLAPLFAPASTPHWMLIMSLPF